MAEHIGVALDDLTGIVLDCSEVWKARFEEIGYVHDNAVCSKIPRAGVKTKRLKVLQTRWIDINKGDVEKSTFPSRVVAMEFNTSQMDGLFAATVPLEALKLLVSDAATVEKCPDSAFKEETAIVVNDVARAFFEALVEKGNCRRAA